MTPKVLLAACAAMDAFISVALIVNKLTVCLCVTSSEDEEPVADKGGGGGLPEAAGEAGAGGLRRRGRRLRHIAVCLPRSNHGMHYN